MLPESKSPKQIFRELRNYLAGRFVGATRDDTLLHELLKCLFIKLALETAGRDLPAGDGQDASAAARAYRSAFARVRKDFPGVYGPADELALDPPTLAHVMRSLTFSLLDAERDPIGDAYEVFAGSESRARGGQFFTPRNAADLLVKAVDPRPGETVIDPACGAGGFLASVARHYRRLGLSPRDVAKAAGKLHGVEKDAYLAALARLHVCLLTGGRVPVHCGDSLALRTEAGAPLAAVMPVAGYDVLLANPPFGVNIVAAGPDVLRTFELARKWAYDSQARRWRPGPEVRPRVPPQVLFVERCLSLVRDGGRLGLVLPESLLSNRSYRYVVEFLRARAAVDAVVGMPEELFKTSGKGGTHTKACLLVLTRGRPAARRKVFMAEARWCGHDSRARDIPHDDLPAIAERFDRFRRGKRFEPSALGFGLPARDIADHVLCPRYYDPGLDAELHRLARTHAVLRLGDLVDDGTLRLDTGAEVGKLAYGTGDVPFVRTSDLSNWEIKADPKHRVSRALYDTLKARQDVRPNDILMVKDGTYLVGTCALVTEHDREIVYQSHLYKLRVERDAHGLNPFLLLAVLSSAVVQRQIKARRFTQDIIDSLGERVRELRLPVPMDPAHRGRITALVKQAVVARAEARELARRARAEVLGDGPV